MTTGVDLYGQNLTETFSTPGAVADPNAPYSNSSY